uniref:DNA-directed RNA polymerase III subunit n=1 Tax=Salix viminalis TaxID=40686 RepID=A0A6N2N8B5_SALVM
MAYRGRGRGRFGGGGGFSYARQEPFDLFPEIELPDPKNVKEERALVVWNSRLTNYFKSSPCYLEEIVSKEIQSMDIERFSDRGKRRITSEHDSLDQFLQLTSKNFPKELIGDLRKLDDYEKRELIYEGQTEKGQMEKKEEEEEDEDQELEEPDDEYDDGDYNQNIDFDDDEDDYNMEDDNADEAIY